MSFKENIPGALRGGLAGIKSHSTQSLELVLLVYNNILLEYLVEYAVKPGL